MFVARVDDGEGQKVICFRASAGMNSAARSVIADTGEDVVKILEEKGGFDKIGHWIDWNSKDMKLFDSHITDMNEDYGLKYLTIDFMLVIVIFDYIYAKIQ